MPATTCRAPFVAIRLAPDGGVYACGVNSVQRFGDLGERSLSEIWTGPELEAFRATLAGGTFPRGCHDCREAVTAGQRHVSHAAVYDEFPDPTDVAWPQRIEFALSNTCNLQCVQCNGGLSSAIRAQREHRPPLRSAYGDEFFDDVRTFLPHLRIATFIGGEPFLMRECRRVWDLMIELGVTPYVHVTTNGTVWNDRVERYLHELKMSVAISIDAVDPATMASIRVGSDLAEVQANRDRFLAATRSYGGDFSINHCVMPQNWREFMPFLLEADELDVLVLNARVLRPHEFSLFSLPAAQLREVVEGMRAQEAADGAALGANRVAWDTTLADLTTHLSALEGEPVPVELRRLPAADTDALARIFADVISATGVPPVHLELAFGHIESITVPQWAEHLGLERCVDMESAAMLAVVEQELGTEIRLVESSEGPGLHRYRYTIDPEGQPTHLDVLAVEPDDDRPGHADVLISRVPS